MSTREHVLLYDCELKAPACVLLQAVMCKGYSRKAFARFSSRHWLVAPTPDMRLIAGTEEEWEKAAAITAKTWGDKRPTRRA